MMPFERATIMIESPEQTKPASPILRFFSYEHLPIHLQEVSKIFGDLARHLDRSIPDSEEKQAGLRRLLEAKDAMVRAKLPDFERGE